MFMMLGTSKIELLVSAADSGDAVSVIAGIMRATGRAAAAYPRPGG
jgi:hypothetical protein